MKKYLIVGLGNTGAKYDNTRHNIGFQLLDHLAAGKNLSFTTERFADRADYRFKGRLFILIKPNTLMNLSGKSVRYWMQKENIALENLLIITDDLNLPFGKIRLKTKGSDGGHNGLKDIQQKINTSKYNRFRFGIGNDYSRGQQIDFVLSTWDANEVKKMPERLDKGVELIRSFGTAGVNITMNTFNNT